MLERVIEERARGDPAAAAAIRGEIARLVGEDFSRAQARLGGGHAPQGGAARAGCLVANTWRSASGPDAEIFTKAPAMAAVGVRSGCRAAPTSSLEQSRARGGAGLSPPTGAIVGATLGNDVNLRDVEGRSALLLGKAKDNNASCAIGPFLRFFDAGFGLDDVRPWR